MTDRNMHSDPSPNLGRHLAAIERRLARRTPADPPAALRSRILEMKMVPASTSVSSPYVVAGTILVLAMSVLLLPLVAMAVAAPRLDRSPPPPRMLSFVERARLAGITIETTAPARKANPTMSVPAEGPRAIDTRTFLEQTHHHGDL